MRTPKFPPPTPWTPQQDVDQSLAYSDPVQQNRALINESRNQRTSIGMNPEWDDYFAVLKGRNAQIGGPLEGIDSGLPAGYTEGALDEELSSFANTGKMGHQGMLYAPEALRGLESASGAKPADRAEMAMQTRRNILGKR